MADLFGDRIVRCPTCGGEGYLLDQRGRLLPCSTCDRLGVAVWWGGQWWSWSQPVSELTVLERRFKQVINLCVNGLAILFLVVGVWYGGQTLARAIQDGHLLSTLLSREWSMVAWWWGGLAGCFLVYRLYRDWYLYPRIPADAQTAPGGDPWLRQKDHHDLSAVFPVMSLVMLEQAWALAKRRKHREVTPTHVLSLLSYQPSMASMIVRMGVNPDTVRARLEEILQHQPVGMDEPVFSAATTQVLAIAFILAGRAGRERVDLPYIVAAIAELDDPARNVLFDLGVDEDKLRHVIAWLIIQDDLRTRIHRYQSRAAMKPRGAVDRGFTAAATPVLDRFSTDLTRRAIDGHLPYVIGRDDEMKKLFRIMESGRRSVILVGESGVGKTTMLYGLAERMAAEDVPEMLQDKRLVSLSSSALVSSTGGLGQLEQRLGAIIREVTRSGNIILAIEDLDQLVGVSSSGSELDAARLLVNGVREESFLAIATAEASAYRRVIEPAGLTAAFEKVEVPEMDLDEAIVAVESRVGALEYKHKVWMTYDAIHQAVHLTQRYLHEKTLPGKALEVLEEAATLAKKSRGMNTLVTSDDVALIISEQSKVNVQSVTTDEQTKLLNLEGDIHGRIVGQEEAVKAVANALRRARAEIRDTTRPIANLLFLGPTGVGKTELAKTVAQVYFGSEQAMVRLDMSEYQEVSSITRLIGTPSSTASGLLTEAIRQRPFTLLLLDELEKAHPDVLNIFLQVMDDGRLTDAGGRTIDFTNVILIATSNAGTQHIQNRTRDGASLETIKQELVNQELQKYFRPEFLNRFDSIVVFKPLSPIDVVKIVALMVQQIAQRLSQRGITLRATPEAIAELAQTGFDPLFGARPLRRLVQEKVDNALAEFLLQGKLTRRDTAVLEAGGVIRVEKAERA